MHYISGTVVLSVSQHRHCRPEVVAESQAPLLLIRDVPASDFARRPAAVTEGLCSFPQSLQANEIVLILSCC